MKKNFALWAIGIGFSLSNCLNGQQNYIIRLTDNWKFLKGDLGGIWEAVRPVKPGNPESLPLWEEVTLPHCFNATDAVDPDVNYYQGPGWYTNQITISNPFDNGRTILHFEGSGQKTQVYIYTEKVGSHIGGYNEWSVDITDAVQNFLKDKKNATTFKGKIPLSIRCDNSRDLEMIPSDLSDFNLYGGLYRYLDLVYVPSYSIERLLVNSIVDSKGAEGKIDLIVRLMNKSGILKAHVKIEIADPSGKIIRTEEKDIDSSDGEKSIWVTTLRKPDLWSPSNPSLYTAIVTLSSEGGTHTVTEKFGFRNFEFVDNGPFKLNGTRLLLRGTHRHEDHAGVAAAMTETMIRSEMIMMKEMGVNFIRLAHYQQSPIVLNLCDSLGILVWEEIPWCRGGLGGDRYKDQARKMLTDMIDQHRNHPAVIIWGLGNENDWPGDFPVFEKDNIRAFMTELNDLSHKLDPSRMTAIRRCDFCKDIVDVYSPSIWAGWYRGIYTEYRETTESEIKNVKHFLHAEWGGDSHAMRHSETPDKVLQEIKAGGGTDERLGDASLFGGAARVSKDGDWSESYICNLIDWHLKEQEKMPILTGSAYWPFKDFSTPIRPENPVPYMNQKGVVERDLTKKEAYYVFQSWWTDKPMVHIYGHSWPVRWGDAGEEKMVKVYSNCEEAELFVNGKSYGVKKRNGQDFPAAGLRWNVVYSPGENTLKIVAKKGKIAVIDEINQSYQTEKWGTPSQMVVSKYDQKGDTATLEVKLKDSKNMQCLDARNQVEFGYSGDGKLLDDMGTSSGSRKVELYNGRAIIRIILKGTVNIAVVKCEGIPTVSFDFSNPELVPGKSSLENKVIDNIRKETISRANDFLSENPVTVTNSFCKRSAGGKHDFYSEGDYWWPDPADPLGPYIQKDGQSNPENFSDHRLAMIRLSEISATLTSAFLLTGDRKYATKAIEHMNKWFVDTASMMNPNMLYAQAISGRFTGRGIGLIDAYHLTEVVQSLKVLFKYKAITEEQSAKIKEWFSQFLYWMTTHQYGIDEMNAKNNHGTCWLVTASSIATLLDDYTIIKMCTDRFKTVLLPSQMAIDGSFPLELKRTKPFGYSLFNIDAFCNLAQILSTPEENLWEYKTLDGKTLKKGMEFIYPFIVNKSKWPFAKDIYIWDEWPVRQSSLLFAGLAYKNEEYISTYLSLPSIPENPEVIRNLPVRHPAIWFPNVLLLPTN